MSLRSENRGDPVLIIGSGLAGLAAGKTLLELGAEVLILERDARPGGLCRTETVGGYTFDYTGHLLHLREGQSRDLIMELVGDQLAEHERKASIYVEDTFVPYPVQAHFGELSTGTAHACMEELKAASSSGLSPDMSFSQWATAQFGPTLARLFMLPYNGKLYQHPLDEMEISWTSWSVPRPSVEEIEAIAAGGEAPSFGYNASFYYPRSGGIEILPAALAKGCSGSIRTGARVVTIDSARRTVALESGDEIPYGKLMSTMPLPELLTMTSGLPGRMREAAGMLRHSSVLGLCLGLDGPVLREDHWIYFPDEDLPFYRAGFPTNFSRSVAPEGCGSVYVEQAFVPGTKPDMELLSASAIETLKGAGVIGKKTEVVARLELVMPCAYVFHDRYRAAELPGILSGLRERGIFSVGRYGAWEYSAMQDAVQWGLDTTRELLP